MTMTPMTLRHLLLWFLPLCGMLSLPSFLWGGVDAAAFIPSSRQLSSATTTFTTLRPIHPKKSSLPLPLPARSVAPSGSNNQNEGEEDNQDDNVGDDDDEEDDNPSSPSSLRRRRDRIRDWIYSSGRATGSSPMVRPIRMEDGSIVEDTPAQPSRLKANFGELFSGMPTMDDILSSGDQNDTASAQTSPSSAAGGGSSSSNRKQKTQADESWFEEEKQQIEANYAEILKEMTRQLEEQRQQEPDSVPSNAEAMIKDVLKQEMKTEIEETKEARWKERLDEYQQTQRQSVEDQDVEGVSNEVVDNLMKEDERLQKQKDAEKARVDDYRRYELEAFLRKPDQGSDSVSAPKANSDLDQWALESLKAMAEKSQNGEKDEEFMVTDLVEERMEDLRERMENEAARSSIKPETMKEWQMYRAIASRLGIVADAKNPMAMQGDKETEERIASQLQSWKDYNAKEEVYRKDSGLSRGPKLPFEWQESGRDKEREDARYQAALKSRGEMSQVEIRKEVNRKSIEALEKLVATSDPIRSERLQKDLDLLKESLESNDYLDVDESTLNEQEEVLGPVDLSDFFSSSSSGDTSSLSPEERFKKERASSGRSGSASPSSSFGSDSSTYNAQPSLPSDTSSFNSQTNDNDKKPSPPNTPFFSQNDGDETPPPPDTPFFSQDLGEDLDEDKVQSSQDEGATEGSGYRLGTIDEQKLRNMYQRAGAKTDEQKAVIRQQWEEFQKFEKSKRDESGLGEGDDSEWLSRASLKYNMSDIAKDGDIDAEKILASIGPRPTRSKRGDAATSSDEETRNEDGTDENTIESNLNPDEVSDSLYRAVSAVGGGRTRDDPEAKAKEKAAYSEYMNRENELRNSLDSLDKEAETQVSNSDETFDDEEYAEDALASLGPRPAKRRRISESEYSDQGIALPDDDGDDDDEVDSSGVEEQAPSQEESSRGDASTSDGPVPGWLRKERQSARNRGGGGIAESFLGSDIDDVFDDDTYEHNMRQLAEYERRRQGGKKQMGIDISDVLGRTSEDYADYNFDDNYFRGSSSGWGSSGFEARKASLLEYTELDLLDVKSLMDHKDSVHSTGVSQYLPRINKPFKEFGAIFRLEGVLLDTTGFQYEAWKRVASEKSFKAPTLEDVRRASVMRPEVAVREAFFWTDNFMLCRETAAAHQRALNDVFDEWMKESAISPPITDIEDNDDDRGSLAMGEELISKKPTMDPLLSLSEEEKINMLQDAWSRTAIVHRLAAPSRDQVEMASVLSPDIAVREAFRWSTDPNEVDKFVATYRQKVSGLSGIEEESAKSGESEKKAPVEQHENRAQNKPLDANAMLEIQFKAWTKLANDNGFELPLPEEVMAAVTINDPLISIRDGFGWTDDTSQLPDLIDSYKANLDAFINEWRGGQPVPNEQPEKKSESSQAAEADDVQDLAPKQKGPNHEELLEMQHYAWQSAALNHGFKVPPADQLEVALKMPPREAISRLFDWTTDDSLIERVCATYDSALRNISQQYLQKYGLKPDFVLFPHQQTNIETPPPATKPKNADVFQAAYGAWTEVAKQNGYKMPDEEEVLFAMSVGPEEAVVSGFEWAEPNDVEKVSKIVKAYKEQLKGYRSSWESQGIETGSTQPSPKVDDLPMFSVVPGAEKWVKSLLDVEMQCAVVSYFNRQQLDTLLEVAGLSHLFGRDKRVSASNNYASDVDQLLGASLRLERRPDYCAVFDSSPYASAAAHEVEMRSVSFIGAFPRYELLSADNAAGSFEELTAMNIRRLFGERVYDQPLADSQQADPQIRRPPKTKYRWGDE